MNKALKNNLPAQDAQDDSAKKRWGEKLRLFLNRNFGDREIRTRSIQQFIIGIIAAGLVLLGMRVVMPSPEAKIGTVNITGLITQFAISQSKLQLPKAQIQKRVKDFGEALEKTTKEIAHSKNILLLPSEAVIAGNVVDYTSIVAQKTLEAVK